MRQVILIVTILITNICYSQTDIPGLYVNPFCDTIWFDLRPDNTYTNYECELCTGPCNLETGQYSLNGDTIFLTPQDTIKKPTKLFYIRSSPTDDNPFSPYRNGNIAPVFRSETILPQNTSWRLSDYETLQWGYVRVRGYYDNNIVMFNTEITSRKTKTIKRYYRSGKIKSIEHYYFDKKLHDGKTGDWYFYSENGQIEKVETYKRNKLKRTNKNAL